MEIKRQAVVVVHGMGEQKPMDTLRSFVHGVKQVLDATSPREQQSRARSQPDSIGDIYETVKINLSKSDTRPITDFYEFYWAHNMRNASLQHMSAWLSKIVFTWYTKIPKRLWPVWFTVWVLIIAGTAISVIIAYNKAQNKWVSPGIGLLIFIVLQSIFTLLAVLSKSLFVNYLGDAARYFTPTPDNVLERSKIRQQGIKFLKKIHNLATHEKVERIIIVAHSLGSVVAYDLLRLLWTEYNTLYNETAALPPPLLAQLNAYSLRDTSTPMSPADLTAYQALQFECWKEQRQRGNKWLITDFVTLGAAVNALDYFMLANAPIETLKENRELPVNPARADKDDQTIYYKKLILQSDNTYKPVFVLNHAALFAVTRWTNIYYTSDFVGGNMQRVFGNGVTDIAIPRKSPWFFPGGHTAYWDSNDKNNALKEIINAMNLNHQ